MKLSKLSIILFGVALLCASSVFAGGANKAKLNLTEKVNVDGKTLDAGNYKVEWTGNGSNVQVTVLRGKETVATFPAQLTESPAQNAADAFGAVTGADGTRSLTTIYVGGKHTILQVATSGASNEQSGN